MKSNPIFMVKLPIAKLKMQKTQDLPLQETKLNLVTKKFLALFSLNTVLLFSTHLQASLQVYPLRTVLTPQERVQQLSLRHRGEKTTTYKISTVFYKMHPSGAMEKLEKAGIEEKNAQEYFRFSPRQVTLEPDKEQVVRLMLRAPEGLAPGDYRTHLYFEEVDGPEIPQALQTNETKTLLKARLAIAVPIIVRVGTPELKARIENVRLQSQKDKTQEVVFDLISEGTQFLYGNFKVFTKNSKNESLELAKVVGVSSYIPKREVRITLTQVAAKEAPLFVEFFENTDSGQPQIYATASLYQAQTTSSNQPESATPLPEVATATPVASMGAEIPIEKTSIGDSQDAQALQPESPPAVIE